MTILAGMLYEQFFNMDSGTMTLNSNSTYGTSIADSVPRDGRGAAAPGIQAALDSGSPLIHIPYGVHTISQGLQISSDTRLVAHPEACFVFADSA